jgi:hypothetical protein
MKNDNARPPIGVVQVACIGYSEKTERPGFSAGGLAAHALVAGWFGPEGFASVVFGHSTFAARSPNVTSCST